MKSSKLFFVIAINALLMPGLATAGGHGGGHSTGHSGGHSTHSTPTHATGANPSRTHVSGYTKKDGTHVAPHNRSTKDGTKANNWSTKGNVHPDTGKAGTKDINSK